MKVGEIWKLKLSNPIILLHEDREPTPDNIIILPDRIELTSINNPPPNTISAIDYPRREPVMLGSSEWGFSVEELLKYFSKDYDASRRDLEI